MSASVRWVEVGDGSAAFSQREREVLELVNRRVAAGESLDEVMGFVFAATREVCPCDRIGLAFVEDEGTRVVSRWAGAAYEPLLLGVGYGEALAGSSLAEVVAAGRPRVIDDLERYLADHPESASTALLVREGVRSSMTCPLAVDGRPVGVLFRSARRPGAYDDHQAALHLAIAERLAQAVEKAWRIAQLTAAARAYSEMLGFVAHELKSPLAGIVMDANVLLGGYHGELGAPQRELVERMVRKSDALLGLVRDYLELARVDGGELEASPLADVDVGAAVIDPALELVAAQVRDRHIRLVRDVPAGLLATCDPELLRVAVANLLSNAVKYGDEGGEVRVRARRDAAALSLAVWNQGPGFPESERSRLFRRFSRLQTPELLSRKGSGVGLYACARIVALHGGRISARSEVGSWAEFSFTIPQ